MESDTSAPANLVQIGDTPWGEWEAPAPFGGRGRAPALPLLRIGLHFEQLDPGQRSCPLHDHSLEEEQFYVLSGTLTVHERTGDGLRRQFELHAGELIAYPAGTRLAHGFSNQSEDIVEFLAFSDRRPGDICTYPDSGKTNLRGPGGGIGLWRPRTGSASAAPSTSDAWFAEAAKRARSEKVNVLADDARPSHVVGGQAPEREIVSGEHRFFGAALSRAAGATAVHLNRDRLPPDSSPSPLHRHRFNEEMLFVLEGTLTLRQVDEGRESTATLAPGHFVHWAPLGVAHQIENRSDRDSSYLVIGTDRGWDVIELPEQGELYLRATGERGTFEPREYFDGERDGSRF